MPDVVFPSGVTVRVPEALQVIQTDLGTSGTRRRPLPTGPISLADSNDGSDFTSDLLDAMSAQDLEVLEKFELQPRPVAASAAGVRSIPALPTETQSVSIDAPVGEDENAVILTEQGGMYAWHLASSAESAASPVTRSVPAGSKSLRFDFELYPPDTTGQPATRNFLTDLAIDGVRAWVLKFAAKATAAEAVNRLERNSRTGFVFLNGEDPEAWPFDAAPGPVIGPPDRPARILLLIHGTFSSTRGSFGALAGTPWGRQFLIAAAAAYDSVVGFDHHTLRETPLENAAALLKLLEEFLPNGSQVDVITHSRGGLVFRSLAEHLLPTSPWQPQIGRVVMVASPNAGTLLAEPENWKTLIDLYTNIAVGACRLLSLMPHAVAVSGILKELVASLGEFLKYLAQDAAGAGGVPGLDAMRTSGAFLRELNETQAGQPGPGALTIYAITSEFAPNLSDPETEPKELPKRLLLMSAEGLINQLMNQANDLVVNTSSMTAIDAAVGNFITDQYSFGRTGKVYHTTYFIRPETINALTRWLRLEAPAVMAQPLSVARKRTAPVAAADIPALVDTDIALLDGADSISHSLAALRAFAPSYAVIRRREPAQDYYYAYTGEELLSRLRYGNPNTDLTEALSLHEYMESHRQTATTAQKVTGDPAIETSNRGIVFVGDLPVGVVPASFDFIANEDLPEIARSMAAPIASPEQNIAIRRTMPTFGPRVNRGRGEYHGTGVAGHPVARVAGVEVPDDQGASEPPPPHPPPPASSQPTGAFPQPAGPPAPSQPPSAPPHPGSAPAPPHPAGPPAPPQAVAPAKVDLHFLAEMPSEAIVGKECSVEVSISREMLAAAVGTASATGEGPAETSRKLIIQIIPRAQFSIEEDRRKVDIPPPGKPVTYYFDVVATHEGEGEIWVVFRQDQEPISTLILQPKVVAAASAPPRRLHAEADAGEPEENAPKHKLSIMDLKNGSEVRYRFEFYSPTLALMEEYVSNAMTEDVSAYVDRLYADIEGRWISTSGDRENFAAEMRAFGSDLFEQLFPPELQKVLWMHRNDIESIMAISTEPFIPWEMVLVREPGEPIGDGCRFLAEMGLVRWLYAAPFPPLRLRIRKGRARYAIPKYPMKDYVLPEAQEEATGLVSRFGATSVVPQLKEVRELLGAKSFDLLHFACHAGAEGAGVSNGKILLEGRIEGTGRDAKYIPATLDAKTVEGYTRLEGADGTRAIVVVNACQAARAGYKLSSTGGFAQSFLKRGAGAFIGALWSVEDKSARVFTEEFYDQLLKNQPVAQAASLARQKAMNQGGATWLAYVVYAHPNAVLSTI